MVDNSNKIEQLVPLKDGRLIFKTNNGFTSYVQDKNGRRAEVTEEYYKKAFKNRQLNNLEIKP
jgi:hypothetical protein